MLEHIEDLDSIFRKVSEVISEGGYVYIGELHPFKQYAGSKARFDTAAGTQEVTCFTHHISDFIMSATKHGFAIEALREYFDQEEKAGIPRILSLLLKKNC